MSRINKTETSSCLSSCWRFLKPIPEDKAGVHHEWDASPVPDAHTHNHIAWGNLKMPISQLHIFR